eukprot:1162021-Pelagomonas_calceolata.AAC.8
MHISSAFHPNVQVCIPDVERNGYTFTDGSGEISAGMMQKVLGSMLTRLRPHEAEGDVSALQVRTCASDCKTDGAESAGPMRMLLRSHEAEGVTNQAFQEKNTQHELCIAGQLWRVVGIPSH